LPGGNVVSRAIFMIMGHGRQIAALVTHDHEKALLGRVEVMSRPTEIMLYNRYSGRDRFKIMGR
jgi:hypothetical protein